MANTKVTQHVIANNAITADQIASAAVTDAKLHATLDLSGKTLTLPATAIPSASTATTQAASDNTTKLATTAYVTTAIANLNDSAPTALNTLNELAAALNDDASFSTTITTALGTKLPLAGGTMTGNIAHAGNFTLDVGGNLTLDSDGSHIVFADAGTEFGRFSNESSNLALYSLVNDKDITLKGITGGSSFSALTLDMSASGFATFNSGGSFGGTGALKIPVGTTGQRPTAATGQLRFNSTDGKLEIYNGSAWANVSAGTSNKVLDTFTGDNSTTAFTLTETPANEDALMVFINGAYQEKGDYSLSGKVLTLDVAPLSGEKVAVHTTIGSVHDGTAALNQQFTATAGQTAFTLGVDPQHENNTQVYINGVYQQKTDYTVSGTTLTFDTGLTVGDVVEVNSFTVTTLGGTDSVTEGVSNLYHTTARARSAISVSGNALSYNSSTGVITSAYEETPTFTGTVTAPLVDAAILDGENFKINGGQGSDGQVITSTGSGVAWESVVSSFAALTDTTVATSDPATNTNPSTGVGTLWLNKNSGNMWCCTDATNNANAWSNIGYGSSMIGSFPPTGGTITTAGGYTFHTFTSSGTLSVPVSKGSVDILIVAGGGGGGGRYYAGGGGAGGMLEYTGQTLDGTHTVVVGAGGAGGGHQADGSDGGVSSVSGLSLVTAVGGGGGGGHTGANGGDGKGNAGGSSGGASGYRASGGLNNNVGAATSGQGNMGAHGGTYAGSGGGGKGAAAAQAATNHASPGGAGKQWLDGTTYAGGGGGGDYSVSGESIGGAGGAGGGGAGGTGGTPDGAAGSANTGGGGGGAQNGTGGAGGSGIVIFRYAT